jgi:hypothetical protein
MTETFETTLVLFVDMLGFADLVEREGDELNELHPIFTGVELQPFRSQSLLRDRFTNFHRCLNEGLVHLHEVGRGTAMVFSDSAFFRLDNLENAIDFARTLMFEMVNNEAPVRMGLAEGSYRMLRFTSGSSADVSFQMSQFLGTGVVRAYRTERCGIPGLRILLHPNLELMLDKRALRIIPVEPIEKMRPDVRSEVNYLEEKEDTLHLGPHYQDCLQFDHLRNMVADTKEAFHYHYIETFKAWNVMRAQLSRAPYPWEKFLDRDEFDYTHGIRKRPAGES